MKKILFSAPIRHISDLILSPLTLTASAWFRYIRSRHLGNMPVTKKIFYKAGVFPITSHYYEPLYKTDALVYPAKRNVPIDLNVDEQLNLLNQFTHQEELKAFPMHKSSELEYHYINDSYPFGDSELLYSMIRHFKPMNIIEIGAGNSSLMIENAVKKNDNGCTHICVEPYEMPWLEKTGVKIIRSRVEEIDQSIFKQLQANDILFIDSSHMIRPQGDVLFEFLELLPSLNPGVIVHIHDIFTPYDYPEDWLKHHNRFWNEQYLLEALLIGGSMFKVILSSYYLSRTHLEEVERACPILATQDAKNPASFWIQKL